MKHSLLGKAVAAPERYAPDVLQAIERAAGRQAAGLPVSPEFAGSDLWTAWELGWLDRGGKPQVAVAAIAVPADSPRLVESKSMKLYLHSLSMERYASADAVRQLLADDLGAATGSAVAVELQPVADGATVRVTPFPGRCIDDLDVRCDRYTPDASLLSAAGEVVDDTLHSHLLQSNCPVTGQPDIGSVLVRYRGPRIDAAGLLRYIVSYRRHSGFHELCVEQMFNDISEHCRPQQLTVYARYNRRGGIDINPFRSNCEAVPDALRLWRQ